MKKVNNTIKDIRQIGTVVSDLTIKQRDRQYCLLYCIVNLTKNKELLRLKELYSKKGGLGTDYERYFLRQAFNREDIFFYTIAASNTTGVIKRVDIDFDILGFELNPDQVACFSFTVGSRRIYKARHAVYVYRIGNGKESKLYLADPVVGKLVLVKGEYFERISNIMKYYNDKIYCVDIIITIDPSEKIPMDRVFEIDRKIVGI